MYKVTQRLYLNSDRSKVVPDTSPDASILLAVAGEELTDSEARRYGLIETVVRSPVTGEILKPVINEETKVNIKKQAKASLSAPENKSIEYQDQK